MISVPGHQGYERAKPWDYAPGIGGRANLAPDWDYAPGIASRAVSPEDQGWMGITARAGNGEHSEVHPESSDFVKEAVLDR